jgi:hypothetical protein
MKELATRSNGREIERTLMFEISFRRTLRLYFEGTYLEDMAIISIVRRAAEKCPSIFASIFNIPLINSNGKEDTD